MAATIEFDIDEKTYIYVTRHSDNNKSDFHNYSIGFRKTIGDIDGIGFSKLEKILNNQENEVRNLRFYILRGNNTKEHININSSLNIEYDNRTAYLDSWFHTIDTPSVCVPDMCKDIKNFILDLEYFDVDESEK